MSLHPKYPNLALLEYKTIQFLYSDQDIKQALEDWKQEHELPLAFPFRVNGNGFVPLMRRQACS